MKEGEFPENTPKTNPLESKELEPKFNFLVLYSGHDSIENFWPQAELETELAKTDIWFPEMLAWDEATEEGFNRYATGKYDLQHEISEPSKAVELKALINTARSGKVVNIGFIDFPEQHPLAKMFTTKETSSARASTEFKGGNFDVAMGELKRIARRIASFERAREDYMRGHIQKKIDDIVRDSVVLQDKIKKNEKLNILITLGTFHIGFFDDLKKEGQVVDQKVNKLSASEAGPFLELVLRYRRKEDVDDTLIARALLFMELWQKSDLVDADIGKLKTLQFFNKLTADLELNDIKNISLGLKAGQSMKEMLKVLRVPLPRSEQEVDAFLAAGASSGRVFYGDAEGNLRVEKTEDVMRKE